ncbi:unnamed protein product [Larinioides sclopetarius]|uniref:Uncharacterized protein n=1 Tax=Larinioides sclopetarius TaxID=280406 RepID=A0AAV2AI75_9ARAC
MIRVVFVVNLELPNIMCHHVFIPRKLSFNSSDKFYQYIPVQCFV